MEKRKKGFTVVELVIVIAVVAILSAVLIPTFVSLVHKAQVTADQSLVKNLNTALALEDNEGGAKPTMYDTLVAMEKRGYVVDRLSPTSADNDIVWDSNKNQFVLVMNKEGKYFTGTNSDSSYETYTDFYKLWKIYKTMPEESAQNYSIYLAGEVSGEVTAKAVGIDVGKNTGITKINYSNDNTDSSKARTVAIRTNDSEFVTELNIEAPTDTINHYGYLTGLDVISVDTTHSYHEYGKVLGRAKVTSGHVVIEEKAEVGELVVAEDATTTTSVEVASNSTVKTLVVENQNVAVEVKENAKVETIVAENTENINIPASVVVETVTKTYVTNETELTNALSVNNSAKYIVIGEDFSLENFINVPKSVVIDGNNKTLTSSATRILRVTENNVDLELKNIKLVGTSSTERAVQVDSGKTGVNLKIDNIDVSGITYYAVNICGNVEVNISITNSKIAAWGAINLWSKKYSVLISNCELYGINDKTYNAQGWNDFGTVVLEGDTTGQTTMHSSEIDVNIVNTSIHTSQTTGNNQYHILFNNPSTSNVVKLTGCSLYKDGVKVESPDVLKVGSGNQLFVDGNLFE